MFERTVCLLLDKRRNEQERIHSEAMCHGLNVEFFLVGDGVTFPAKDYGHIDIEPPARTGYPAWAKRSNSYNAFLSFRKIVAKAKNDKVESLLLLEDDATFLPEYKTIFPLACEQLPDLWEMFYLGANHAFSRPTMITPNILRLNGSGGWWAVALRNTIFDAILNLPITNPIDGVSAQLLHGKHLCYACWPSVIWQRPGFSYCEGRDVDYSHFRENSGCH